MPNRFQCLIALCILCGAGTASADIPDLPRGSVIASYYMGLFLGRGALDEEASARAKAGSGVSFEFALGISFFDEIPLNFALGQMFLDDHEPFQEYVETCESYAGSSLGCSTARQQSHITVGQLRLDTGYQHRFRVLRALALVPAALVGYSWNQGGLKREIGCDGCSSIPIEGVSAAGAYVAPALRVVFTNAQFFALEARYEYFLNGHRDPIALFGFEVFAP
ncbi:MAG: hypothetical protein ABW061_01775 [Polyangiaceae bacterium]